MLNTLDGRLLSNSIRSAARLFRLLPDQLTIALVGILFLPGLTGCNQDQITSYRVPKEKAAETMASDSTPGAPTSLLHWVTPAGCAGGCRE